MQKISIKREQSQAGLSFAERKNFRPKVKKNKLFLLLALLLTAATGAWAQEETLLTTLTFGESPQYGETTSGVVSVTAIHVEDYYAAWGWIWDRSGSLSVTAKDGYTITKCVFRQNEKTPITDTEAPFEIHYNDWGYFDEDPYYNMNGVTSIEVYGYAPAAPTTYTVSLKDGVKDADKWTISPNPAEEGQTVTLTYTGRLKVKGVKATSDAAAPSVPDGALSGVFSVSSTKKVYFSKGNLRYASGAWSFFDNQYDYYESHSADAWDKFGWSTSAPTYGMSTSNIDTDYSGDFVDWGATMGTGWFTLSSDEWTYLFNTRSASTVGGTENGCYAKAKVNNVPGIILFPDTYTHPDGVTAPTGVNAEDETGWNGNSYTVADWTKMESAGCVFLPAAGYRNISSVNYAGSNGIYWSATLRNANRAYEVYFNSSYLYPADHSGRHLGCSVRLVREVATSDEEQAAASLIVNPVVGQVIGSDGKNYDANATLPTGVTAVAKICYVGSDNGEAAPYNHGLALALSDVSSSTYTWCSQTSATCLASGHQFDSEDGAKGDLAGIANTDALVSNTGHTHAAASAARNYNSGTHPTGTSAWFLPSAGQWDKMATAAGGYGNLKTNAGLQSYIYWSSTEVKADRAWSTDFSDNGYWGKDHKDYEDRVRPCLAF